MHPNANPSAPTEFERSMSVRPVLTLKANLITQSGDGKSANTAYTFE